MSYPKGKYAWTVKVGEKGQIVIPKEARDVFDINPGDSLIVLGDVKKGIAIPPKNQMNKLMAMLFDGEMPAGGDDE
jgi:AbrB family looped-hinge helix DNA binding protein